VTKSEHARLSPLEREIMNVLYGSGEAGAAEVAKQVSQKGGHDSVRVTLRILEKKGHIKHRQDGRRYVYSPTVPHRAASRSAIRGLIRTFFRGSPKRAVLALLGMSRLSKDELDEIAEWVEEARRSHESHDR
jgi:predicted transcriptional regulator